MLVAKKAPGILFLNLKFDIFKSKLPEQQRDFRILEGIDHISILDLWNWIEFRSTLISHTPYEGFLIFIYFILFTVRLNMFSNS